MNGTSSRIITLAAGGRLPSDTIVSRYQLGCSGDDAHAVVMPSVSGDLLQQFAADYLAWWSRS